MEGSSPAKDKQIRRRSTNACDACRSRKVKCQYEESDLVCKACRELDIQCTYNKPRRRRGPRNQYVLDQNRTTVDEPSPISDSPASVTTCGSDRLAPFTVIEPMIHDWFDLIHSVCPIFHRGIFLARLASGEAKQDGILAALVISVCAATCASLKRKSTKYYGVVTLQRCVNAIEQIELRTGKFPFSLEWCQMKYHLCVAFKTEKTHDDVDGFRLSGEAITGVKFLLYYKMQEMDTVSQQLLKRLYWLLFVGLCTSDLHGRPYVGLLTPQDNISALTPLELSDNELDATSSPLGDLDWHGNAKSYIPGLNHLSKLFLLWHQSQQEPELTISHLQHYSNLVQRALDYLPPELKWRGGLSRPPQSNFGTDVQTANLYITQLHIRSNLLEQIRRISKTSGTQTPPEVSNERQSIVGDLLEILYHTSQETLEANGHSLIPKIRDLGFALLDEVRTGDGQQGMSPNASVNLERLLAKLEDLDIHSQLQYMQLEQLPDMERS